jgi:hypothetical protein
MATLTRSFRNLFAVAAFAALPLVLTAGAASAGVVTVQYNVTSGTLDALFGSTPYTGGGTYTVRYQASSASALQPGPATLVTLNVTAGPSRPGLLGAPGSYPVSFYTPALMAVVGASAATGFRTATATTSMIPGYTGILIQLGNANRGAAGWHTVGPGSGRLTLSSMVASAFFLIPNTIAVFSGQEINRTFVPEPASGTLVLIGLAGLAGFGAAQRRRTRA